MGVPLAALADLRAQWPSLPSGSDAQATALLSAASAIVRAEVRDLDARIAAGSLDGDLVAYVVCKMVERAMAPIPAGVSSVMAVSGPFSQQLSYGQAPGAMLALLKSERRVLGGSGARAFSVDPTPRA